MLPAFRNELFKAFLPVRARSRFTLRLAAWDDIRFRLLSLTSDPFEQGLGTKKPIEHHQGETLEGEYERKE